MGPLGEGVTSPLLTKTCNPSEGGWRSSYTIEHQIRPSVAIEVCEHATSPRRGHSECLREGARDKAGTRTQRSARRIERGSTVEERQRAVGRGRYRSAFDRNTLHRPGESEADRSRILLWRERNIRLAGSWSLRQGRHGREKRQREQGRNKAIQGKASGPEPDFAPAL